MADPLVDCLFHKATNTCTFVVADPETKKCAIIDSVWDYAPESGTLSSEHNLKTIELVKTKGYSVEWILETHVHADHITGSQGLKKELGGKVAMGRNVIKVQETFKTIFNVVDFVADGSQFDHLFVEGETFHIGNLKVTVLETPGHTPADVTYLIGNSAFTGDTAFMPDIGTARCDFPKGSVEQLYHSVKKIQSLPDTTRWYVGHDYPPAGREVRFDTTVAEQKRDNKHIKAETTLAEFKPVREARDKTLDAPRLLLPSLQVNMRAGKLPQAEGNGKVYLKIPLTVKL